MMSTHLRSFIKAISWRILGTFIGMGLIFTYTQDWDITASIGSIDVVVKTIAYYIHERTWLHVPWGQNGN